MDLNRRELLQMGLCLGALPLGQQPKAGSYRPIDTWLVGENSESSFEPSLEIKKENLTANVNLIHRKAGNRPVLAVLKNNAYGHGLMGTAQILEKSPVVHGFAVVTINEALELREKGIQKPILLLGPSDNTELDQVCRKDIMPSISTDRAPQLAEIANELGRPVPVHVYVDTGLGRAGIPWQEALPLFKGLARYPQIIVDGTFTDLTEDSDADSVQIQRLLNLKAQVENEGLSLGNLHAASSHALFTHQMGLLNWVRPGLALYGGFRSGGTLPTISLTARVMKLKHLQTGDWLQYNKAYVAKKPVWVASLAVGHHDGLPSSAVGNGSVMVRGKRYPIIASITANHTLIEVGSESTLSVGDTATFFGFKSGEPDSNAFAGQANKNIYQFLMHLNSTMKRRYI